ncbi:unnamed protein product [Pedinophyceae sp. YPF-701]|nr:unnamed protein product [Pedinophyceae sp. YPF-701]
MDSDRIRDNLDVMASLIAELDAGDSEEIAAVHREHQELRELISESEGRVQNIIQGLAADVEALSREAAVKEDPAAHRGRVDDLRAQQDAAKGAVQALSSELGALRGQRETMARRFQELRSQRARIDQLASEKEPQARNQLTLYAHISRATLRLDQYPRRLAGTVASLAATGPRTFDLDLTAMSQCEIADTLWGLMGDE